MPRIPQRTAWLLALVIVALLAFFSLQSFLNVPGRTMSATGDALTAIAAAFRDGTIDLRFSSFATEITGSRYLQFATLNEVERFERIDSTTVLWGTVPLPDVVVRATAPVEYTYYLDLEEPWSLKLVDGIVTVKAPAIQFNQPSIDISELHFEVRQTSILRDSAAVEDTLRRGLRGLTQDRARDNIELVREIGRRRVEEFVRDWLLDQVPDSQRLRIDVSFADEDPRPTRDLSITLPTEAPIRDRP